MFLKILNILQKLLAFHRKTEKYPIQTFTYFIPAPPERKSGYREKQFDKIFCQFLNRGYDILSINTEAMNGKNHNGMWIIFTLRAKNAKAAKLDINFEDQNNNSNNNDNNDHDNNDIEGLYYVDSQ
ncbi:MAG: hypothetical protein KAQ98_03760 [Bacteriovoracaceae bacterium]|nr:hypothetical protein [Bacteriovoracaceae bacterium]